jgi:hypothetical protein
MFQVFHLDVAKIDLDVAYICMLQAYISSVLGVSYVCLQVFLWMLQIFAKATHMFKCFASVLIVCCKSFSYSGCMLKVFHLDDAKVDLMLHTSQWGPTYRSCLLQLLGRCHGSPCGRLRPAGVFATCIQGRAGYWDPSGIPCAGMAFRGEGE